MATIDILKSDDTTPAIGYTLSEDAGTETAALLFHVWYNKGSNSGIATGVSLFAEVEDPNNPGTYLREGLEPLDKGWISARVVDGNNAANSPLFVAFTTPWTLLSSSSTLSLQDLPGNTARYVEVVFRAPLQDGMNSSNWNWRIRASWNESVFNVTESIGLFGTGILTGVGISDVTEFWEAPSITEYDTPNQVIEIFPSRAVISGRTFQFPYTTPEFSQNDSADSALAEGEQYKAIVYFTRNGIIDPVKGLKSSGTASAPAFPAGSLPVAIVTVLYNAGGTVIEQAHIQNLTQSGRFKPTSDGLTLNVASGRAIVGNALIDREASSILIPADSTRYVYMYGNGTLTALESEISSGFAVPIAKVVAGPSSITEVIDRRVYFEPKAEIVRLKKAGAIDTTGDNVDRITFPYRWQIDRYEAYVRVPGESTDGTVRLNLTRWRDGDEVGMQDDDFRFETNRKADLITMYVNSGEAGDYVTLNVDDVLASGTPPEDAEVQLVVYPLP